jgi:hypothetical protein
VPALKQKKVLQTVPRIFDASPRSRQLGNAGGSGFGFAPSFQGRDNLHVKALNPASLGVPVGYDGARVRGEAPVA